MGAAFCGAATALATSIIISLGTQFVQVAPQEARLDLDVDLQDMAVIDYQAGVEAWQYQNLLGAIGHFLRSAQKGHEVGEYCFRFGQYHELPPSDMKQALRWYERGARMRHQASTTALGKLHLAMGHWTQAKQFLTQTAMRGGIAGDRGDSLAQWFLAEMYHKGGALRNAVRWWKLSAENGDIDAMMRLSNVFLEGGAGIPQEEMRSRHWFLAAAAHGHQGAINNVSWNQTDRSTVEQRWFATMEQKGWL